MTINLRHLYHSKKQSIFRRLPSNVSKQYLVYSINLNSFFFIIIARNLFKYFVVLQIVHFYFLGMGFVVTIQSHLGFSIIWGFLLVNLYI